MTEHWDLETPEATPLRLLERFSAALGAPVYIKHDDYGPLSWAGSKSRKLRAILAAAVADGVDTVVMSGPAQSNSCRALAALARPFGLHAHLVLHGRRPLNPTGNLKITDAMGAEVTWAGNVTFPDLAAMAEGIAGEHRRAGRRVMLLPPGASSAEGVEAILHAGRELAQQLAELSADPVEVVHASASGGLHAGLWLASRLADSPPPRSVMIVREIYEDVEATYAALVDAALTRLGPECPRLAYGASLDWSAVGPGYGMVTGEALAAAQLLAYTEGILVDTTYTGKALGVLVRRAREGHSDPVVFWHSGGLPGFF
jgi:1-aminocyclopropane-1-carboxylate deaminase/D-cysteine desulfhydrase-like pyridoxal-dependent ACC family enzyme